MAWGVNVSPQAFFAVAAYGDGTVRWHRLSDGEELLVAAVSEATRLILVAGKPLNEPVAKYGPFVMNTPEQIVEAIRDYQAGKF